MTSVSDYEWNQLARTWTDAGDRAETEWIRERVRRKTRALRWVVASEVAITFAVVLMLVAMSQTTPSSHGLVIGAATLGHTAICWGFAIWNRAGIWRPLGESTRDYLVLARERCRRERRSARFVIALVAVETLAMTAWAATSDRPAAPQGLLPTWWLSPTLVIGGAIGWALWAERRARRELARLDAAGVAFGFGVA